MAPARYIRGFCGRSTFPQRLELFSFPTKRKLLHPSGVNGECPPLQPPEASGRPGVPLIDQVSAAGSPARRQDVGQATLKPISSTRTGPFTLIKAAIEGPRAKMADIAALRSPPPPPGCQLLRRNGPVSPERRPAALGVGFRRNRRPLSTFDSLTAATEDHREL